MKKRRDAPVLALAERSACGCFPEHNERAARYRMLSGERRLYVDKCQRMCYLDADICYLPRMVYAMPKWWIMPVKEQIPVSGREMSKCPKSHPCVVWIEQGTEISLGGEGRCCLW